MTQRYSLLTCVIVEESVLPPKHLRGLHDDGIGKLFPYCSLSHSLQLKNETHKDLLININSEL